MQHAGVGALMQHTKAGVLMQHMGAVGADVAHRGKGH